jgi:hypothetical protein
MPKSETVLVGPVTLSYPDGLFEARPGPNGGAAKYGCNIIYSEQTKQQIEALVEKLGQQAFPSEWAIPNRCKKPIRVLAEKPAYTEQANKLISGAAYFSSLSSGKYAPQVLDPNKQPILSNQADPMGRKPIYGGVQAYCLINAYSYRHPQGGPGVSLGVTAVMKYMDSEPLVEGGSLDVNLAFANVPQAPAAAASVPNFG